MVKCLITVGVEHLQQFYVIEYTVFYDYFEWFSLETMVIFCEFQQIGLCYKNGKCF